MLKSHKQVIEADGSLAVSKIWDFTQTQEDVRQIRDIGANLKGDIRHVGRIPAPLVTEWLKEAGVSWSDTEAARQVVERKLLSGDYNSLRPWEGTF